MDITIRNLDPDAYRRLKAEAALRGKTVGEALSDILLAHVATRPRARRGSLRDLPMFDFPPGNERLSEEIDKIVYGV